MKLPIVPAPGKSMLFSAIANDADGGDRLGWVHWSYGLGRSPKNYRLFGSIAFTGEAAGTVLTDDAKGRIQWPDVDWDRNYRIYGFKGTPKVDGIGKDAVWGKVEWTIGDRWSKLITPAETETGPVDASEATKSMKFKLLYDDEWFYFLVVTTDDQHTLPPENLGSWYMWMADCVQMGAIDVPSFKREMERGREELTQTWDEIPRPTFAIYHGKDKIASGSFEYG